MKKKWKHQLPSMGILEDIKKLCTESGTHSQLDITKIGY
jgi:hypothetical protein